MSKIGIYFFLLLVLSTAHAVMSRPMTASDKEEWERRGLSQIEWEMVLDARMPMIKLDELQEAGISISEYFRYPWLNYGISEKEWLKSRKAGLLESDISNENKPPADNSGTKKIFSSFLLPGYHQFKQKAYWKGAVMTSVAATSLAITAGASIKNKKFTPTPLLLVIPVMLWSSLDIGLQLDHEQNPEAQRFSNNTDFNMPLRVTLSIKTR